MFPSWQSHESSQTPSFRHNGRIPDESQRQWSTVVMWQEEQSAMRLKVYAFISQVAIIQQIKFIQARRFTFFIWYEAAKHGAKIEKRFNTETFMTQKIKKIGFWDLQKSHLSGYSWALLKLRFDSQQVIGHCRFILHRSRIHRLFFSDFISEKYCKSLLCQSFVSSFRASSLRILPFGEAYAPPHSLSVWHRVMTHRKPLR